MLQEIKRTIRQDVSKAVSTAKGVIGKAKAAVSNLGKERYDRATYVSPAVANQSKIKHADAILTNRPNILNESDHTDPEFRTVVEASALRGNKAK